MKKTFSLIGVLMLSSYCFVFAREEKRSVSEPSTKPEWRMNATTIEACSCPMFCQCYFNTKPAGHHEEGGEFKHYCRSNMVFKINKGEYGSIKLDGARFWIAADIGDDFSKGQMEWAVLIYDKANSMAQRNAILTIVSQLFPVKWRSFTTSEGTIDQWAYTGDMAHATLDGGKTAEVKLRRFPGMTNEPVVIRNLKYWAAPRNDGYVLMPNELEAYRAGPKTFEYKGTSGFMITIDMKSKDF